MSPAHHDLELGPTIDTRMWFQPLWLHIWLRGEWQQMTASPQSQTLWCLSSSTLQWQGHLIKHSARTLVFSSDSSIWHCCTMPTLQLRMRNIVMEPYICFPVDKWGVLYAESVQLTEKNFYGCRHAIGLKLNRFRATNLQMNYCSWFVSILTASALCSM